MHHASPRYRYRPLPSTRSTPWMFHRCSASQLRIGYLCQEQRDGVLCSGIQYSISITNHRNLVALHGTSSNNAEATTSVRIVVNRHDKDLAPLLASNQGLCSKQGTRLEICRDDVLISRRPTGSRTRDDDTQVSEIDTARGGECLSITQ